MLKREALDSHVVSKQCFMATDTMYTLLCIKVNYPYCT